MYVRLHGRGWGWRARLVLNSAHQQELQLTMASSDRSAVTLVSRRTIPSLEEIQSTEDTIALLAESSLSEAEEVGTHEGDGGDHTFINTCITLPV